MSPQYVTARLNDRARPMDRGDIYADPLHEVLKSRALGAVTGGGSQLGQTGEIMFCDLEIEVNDTTDATLAVIAETLNGLGAPKGSRILVPDQGLEIPFGKNEGLAVYLNGTDLPMEVYQQSDVNFVWSEFERLLHPHGRIHSYWEGETETALYMYGPSFREMHARIAEFMTSYALCQRARVEQIS